MASRQRHSVNHHHQQPQRPGSGDGEVEEEEDEESVDQSLIPWPAMGPPFFVLPPPYTGLPELLFPFDPFVDDRGYFYDPYTYPPDYGDSVDYQLQDESVYQEYPDVLRQFEYARYLQPTPPFWDCPLDPSFFLDVPETEDYVPEGTGEPHTVSSADITDDVSMHVMSTEGCGDAQMDTIAMESGFWGMPEPYYGPVVTNYGTISVILRHCIRVDITVDRAVRVVNFPRHCTAAIGSWGDRSCVCHPCGRVLQEGISVDMATGNRLAKISSRGVTFTALNHGLVYLVDASGTKSTTERFQNLCYDLPMSIFYFNSEQGVDAFQDCFQAVSQARQRTTRSGDDVWIIAGVRIKQTPWGDVQVSRDAGRRVIWTSPTAGTISVTTPFVKMAIGCDPWKYFFVRMGQKRLSANVEGFTVRNGSQRAGFDSRGRLTLP
ncbi:uncharacterized protein LOC135366150 isoform X2 [Ornithodoros turicata]